MLQWIVGIVALAALALVIFRYRIYRTAVCMSLGRIKEGSMQIHGATGKVLFSKKNQGGYDAHLMLADVDAFFGSAFYGGELGIGESYAAGLWSTPDILAVTMVLVGNRDSLQRNPKVLSTSEASDEHDKKFVRHHYDVGNDFYESFLKDRLMAYSCGFFFCPTDDLDRAQHNKVDHIVNKLSIGKGDSVLDIGCGWGRIAAYVSQKTGSSVHGITISQEQSNYINSVGGVSASVTHYLSLPGLGKRFDKIYSIGMFEHVRCINYAAFFKSVGAVLKDGGSLLIHTITTHRPFSCKALATENFVTKHIFPGGQIPKIEWILEAALEAGFRPVHQETFGGHHYAKTLAAWRSNLTSDPPKKYPASTIRGYEYYMAVCEAAFLLNHLQLSQFIFSKGPATTVGTLCKKS